MAVNDTAAVVAKSVSDFLARASAVKAATVTALIERARFYTPVDTGELRDGWHDDGTAADIAAVTRISNEVEHGVYQEFGTSRQEPRAMTQKTINDAPAIAAEVAEKFAAR